MGFNLFPSLYLKKKCFYYLLQLKILIFIYKDYYYRCYKKEGKKYIN